MADQALAILTYCPIGSENTEYRLRPCLESLSQSNFPGDVFVIDDGSASEHHLAFLDKLNRDGKVQVIHREHGGNSRAKNTALVSLRDSKAKYLFLAEDDILLSPGWNDHYLRSFEKSGIKMFSFACPPCAAWQKQTVVGINHHPVKETNWLNGCFLAFTPEVIHTIGGFANLPAPYGYGHINWTWRAIAAGLTPFYADALGSNNFIRVNPQQKSGSVFSREERLRFAGINEKPARNITRIFHPLTEYTYEELSKKWVNVGGTVDMAISKPCWEKIESFLKPEMQTLEAGSGLSTWLFAQSVDFHQALENHEESYQRVCLNRARGAQVSLCPLIGDPPWYDFNDKRNPYDLILIDGPSGEIGRSGILQYLDDLIHEDTKIVLDDTHRHNEARLALAISEHTGKFVRSYFCDDGRSYSVIE